VEPMVESRTVEKLGGVRVGEGVLDAMGDCRVRDVRTCLRMK
jgi:hypothetical protein